MFLLASLGAVATAVTHCKLQFGDTASGGACYVSENSSPTKLTEQDRVFEERRAVKEWHIHVYFFQNNPESVAAAQRLRMGLVDQVRQRNMIVVVDGVTNEMVAPRVFKEADVPPVNMGPRGPHPCGSYEVWVPQEYFSQALGYVALHRGQLSVLVHPLTEHEVEDHTARAMWMGSPFRLDMTALTEHGLDNMDTLEGEYPGLGLGYNATA